MFGCIAIDHVRAQFKAWTEWTVSAEIDAHYHYGMSDMPIPSLFDLWLIGCPVDLAVSSVLLWRAVTVFPSKKSQVAVWVLLLQVFYKYA
jgi:hypothetical protein